MTLAYRLKTYTVPGPDEWDGTPACRNPPISFHVDGVAMLNRADRHQGREAHAMRLDERRHGLRVCGEMLPDEIPAQRAICAGCPQLEACRLYGIVVDPSFGVLGGLDPVERMSNHWRQIALSGLEQARSIPAPEPAPEADSGATGDCWAERVLDDPGASWLETWVA